MTVAPAALAPPMSISELRAWLTAAQEMLQSMGFYDPRYAPGLEIWQARHDAYMARALAEGEPE